MRETIALTAENAKDARRPLGRDLAQHSSFRSVDIASYVSTRKDDMYQNIQEIEDVVRKFESCEYSPADFTHALHLTAAAWYLSCMSPAKALEVMREKLMHFSEHHGKMGYHETITRFWLDVVGHYLREAGPAEPLTSTVNKLLREYADKNLLFQHYSRELVMSELARAQWIEPDLRDVTHH